MIIYLAGPMPTERNWRKTFKSACDDWCGVKHKYLDPEEFKEHLRSNMKKLEFGEGTKSYTFQNIPSVDKWLINKSDIIVANVTKLSCGTSQEIMYAKEKGKLVIVIGEQEIIGVWHRDHSLFCVGYVEQAYELIKRIGEYVGN